MWRAIVLVVCCAALAPAWAQDAGPGSDETLADIRQDLTVLNVEIQKLKRELSTTGGAALPGGGDMLDRVTSIEDALQGLTAKTEELEFRINRIVQDGTNRIGDLEFRLVELEGGDVSQLGETSTLGGAADQAPIPTPNAPGKPEQQLAIGETADFDAAQRALNAGDSSQAAALFARFNETYPGSPLAVEASLGRGTALEALGDTREAARAYLDAYNADVTGPRAAEALLKLGRTLGALGQVEAACQILAQVDASFSTAAQAPDAARAAQGLGCL